MILLTLKEQPSVPLEAETLSPDVMATLSHDEARALPVYLGKRRLRVDDFFDVEGAGSDELEIRGAAGKVKWIGRGMTRGHIRVVGDAGMHLGAYMKGGAIEVSGNASDWVGAEMSGGLIRIRGNAGGQVGAAYRGSSSGMRDGMILIGGSAGMEVGMRMKRGVIAVGGAVRDFAGLQMKGGTIFLLGGAEIRTGAWMLRGTHRLPRPDSAAAHLLLRLHLQPNVPAVLRQALARPRHLPALRFPRRLLPAFHRRRRNPRQGRNPRLATQSALGAGLLTECARRRSPDLAETRDHALGAGLLTSPKRATEGLHPPRGGDLRSSVWAGSETRAQRVKVSQAGKPDLRSVV